MKRGLTCGFVEQLDKVITLARRRGLMATRRPSVWRRLCLSLCVGLAINTINTTTLNAYPLTRTQQDWALVAMNHLGDLQEAQCWVELIWRESTFNPNARNGSHYGLAQMRNHNVRTLSPRTQVRWHMRYLDHRYPKANGKGSACKALNHLNKKGWH